MFSIDSWFGLYSSMYALSIPPAYVYIVFGMLISICCSLILSIISFSAAGVSVGAPHFLLIGGTAPIPLHAPVSLHSLLCIPLVHSPHCVHIQSGRQYIPPP